MLAIQPRRGRECDEELAAVRVRTTVRHAQNPGPSMLQSRMNLVLELFAVDRAASATGSSGIASLYHEVRDDAMEDDVVVVASLSESRKVLASLQDQEYQIIYSFIGAMAYEPLAHVHCRVRR